MGRTYANTPVISKINIGGSTKWVKDADARALLDSINADVWGKLKLDLGSFETNLNGLVDASTVKSYVDEIAKLGFEVIKLSELPAATKENYEKYQRKLIVIPVAGQTYCDEYIIMRDGTDPAYTYHWELIGTTSIDISKYVSDVKYDLTGRVLSMQKGATGTYATIHEFGALADKDDATGTVEGQTISGVKATGAIPTATVDEVDTDATLTKESYTPAGTIKLNNAAQETGNQAVTGGSITVTLKDADTKTAITDLEYESYTPAGTVTAADDGSFAALTGATFVADANGVQITGEVSKPAINVTAGIEKTFATNLTGGSVASINTSKFSGGSLTGATQASFTQGTKASLTTTNITYVEEGFVASYDITGEELTLTAATTGTAKAVNVFTPNGDDSFTKNDVGTFTAATIEDGFFTPNVLQSVVTDTVHDTPSAALANAPEFTGGKYKVNTSTDTALKSVVFTGTSADIKLTGAKYFKQAVDAHDFTPTYGTFTFAGTEKANAIVTNASYKRTTINTTGATSAVSLDVGDIAVAAKQVTVF